MENNTIQTEEIAEIPEKLEEWSNTSTGEVMTIQNPSEHMKAGWGGKRAGAGRKALIDFKETYFVRAFNLIGEDSIENIQYLINMRKGLVDGAGPKEQLMASKILFDKFMPNMVITKDMTEDPNENTSKDVNVIISDYGN